MALRFTKLTRQATRALAPGQRITEHGIIFERLGDGDGRFGVNVMVDGQRIHRALGRESDGVTRGKAEEFIEASRTKARESRLNLPKGRKVVLGFRAAGEAYIKKLREEGGKDIAKKDERLKVHLAPFFGNVPLDKVASFDLERYKKARLGAGAAQGTVNRELAVLSHLFGKAVDWGWLTHKPARINRLSEGSGRYTYLTTEQISELREAAEADHCPWIYPFIVIALETSMRRTEVLSIRLEHIDLERRVIYIAKAKAGAREQPITGHLAEFLRGYVEAAGEGQQWLFPSPQKTSSSGHVRWIEVPFRRVVIAAGLDPKLVVRHTLRHTAITHLVQAGVDLPTVQRISGHKTLQMVARYAHQNGEHIQAAMDKLESRYRPETSDAVSDMITPKLHQAVSSSRKTARANRPQSRH